MLDNDLGLPILSKMAVESKPEEVESAKDSDERRTPTLVDDERMVRISSQREAHEGAPVQDLWF